MRSNEMFYYFAYGSNMNADQMKYRCPGAEITGPATLPGYRLTERRHADIDKSPGDQVNGLLWRVTAADLRKLDIYEGYPRYYERYFVDVEINGMKVSAIVYEMTPQSKQARDGERYSNSYRQVCSEGAAKNGVINAFV